MTSEIAFGNYEPALLRPITLNSLLYWPVRNTIDSTSLTARSAESTRSSPDFRVVISQRFRIPFRDLFVLSVISFVSQLPQQLSELLLNAGP